MSVSDSPTPTPITATDVEKFRFQAELCRSSTLSIHGSPISVILNEVADKFDALRSALASCEQERDEAVTSIARAIEMRDVAMNQLAACEQHQQEMRETGVSPARILERLKELQKHTHGMAYPEGQTCAVCEEESEIKDFLSWFATALVPEARNDRT